MSSSESDQTRPQDVLAAVERTSYGEIVRDTDRRRQLVYEAMLDSPDPIGREIGQQLQSGKVTMRDLLTLPEYHTFFMQSLATGERLQLDDLAHFSQMITSDGGAPGDLRCDTNIRNSRDARISEREADDQQTPYRPR